VGKTTAARLLARAINCEKGPTATPCGTCAACVEISQGSSVDVAEIDGASNNGVDDVRAIRENARYLPSRDRFKIYIIDEVHMLSQAAFNALLKTLEEPPPHVKFIFATTEAHKVPETIISRCQLHTFRRIPLAKMTARLSRVAAAEKLKLGDDVLALIARQAEGGMRDALSLLDQVISACGDAPSAEEVADALGAVDRRSVLDLVSALVQRRADRIVAILSEQYDRGTDPRRLCEALCQELRNLLVCRLSGKAPSELPDHEQRQCEALSKEAEPAQLARLFELCHEMLGEMGRAFDPRLALEVALLKGVYLAPGASVLELLERTEALAKGLPLPSRGVPPAPVPAPTPSRPAEATKAPTEAKPAQARPASPPAQAPGGLTPAEVKPADVTKDAFQRAATAILRDAPRLGSALKNGRLRSASAGRIGLAFPAGDFRGTQLVADLAEVEKLLAKELGGRVKLEVLEGVLDGDAESLADQESRGEEARAERVREATRSSSAVRDAVRILGGTIEEIRVPAGRKAGGDGNSSTGTREG
jgi:DNA polymerase-3 subunit gamma/tau